MPPPQSREDWIVREARKRAPTELAAFLDGACAEDEVLRQRVEALLAAKEQRDTTPATAPDGGGLTLKISVADGSNEGVGQSLGRYKLLEKVGEGGFGVVYVAEQKEPVKRRVALKIIKLGMDTRQVVARFEAERQALAMMDHPNIAKVLDAGATDQGRPYFVMELVRGVKLTDYCDQNKLPARARIDLFVKVCQAIQHAHQKGIIHRDIKPSNILVTLHDGVPVPKVIDFGIAKATQQDLTDKTVYTQLQQFVGTPAYMSPEQAEMSGLDIDTRSDIYSLGVLLYELLTGRTPFDAKELMAQGIDAMRKTIREKEPLRPSTKVAALQGEELTTTAAHRGIEVPKLISLLRGDLDWIVMKCLEKDRTRRYETANGLAADLKRHLNNELVTARPPSASYRLQKSFRRNKFIFATAAAVAVALILGVIGITVGLVRARHAQTLALQSRIEAEKLSNFMLDDLYAKLEPSGDFETVVRLAKQAVAYYDGLPPSLRTRQTDRNRAIARARLALATAKQGDYKTAVPLATESVADLQRMRQRGDQSEGTLFALVSALEAYFCCYNYGFGATSDIEDLSKAVQALQPVAVTATASRRIKLEYANTLNFLSHAQPHEQGTATCQQALRILTGLGALELSDLSAGSAWADIADSEAREALWNGRIDEAERLEKQVMKVAQGVLDRRPADLRARQGPFWAADMLGLIEARRFHDTNALQFLQKSRDALEDYLRFNPSDLNGLPLLSSEDYTASGLLLRCGRINEALEKLRPAAQKEREHRHSDEPFFSLGSLWSVTAIWEAQRGNQDSAEQALQEARQSVEAIKGRELVPDRSKEGYEQIADDAERQVKLAFGQDDSVLRMAGDALARLDKFRETEPHPEDIALFSFLERQALEAATRCALKLGRVGEADTLARKLVSLPSTSGEFVERLSMSRPIDLAWAKVLMAQSQLAQGDSAEALRTLGPVLATYRNMQVQGATHLTFRQHFARALYVQALAQPDGGGANARQRDSLDQAARLLNDLSDEARQLHDTKELLAWIETEQKKLGTGTPP